jgi:hypothetical protein
MDGSVTGIVVICVVAVAGLAIWLIAVALAARKPRWEHVRGGRRMRGSVQGGMHVAAGGRSVAPRRDEPVTPPAATLPQGTGQPDAAEDDRVR